MAPALSRRLAAPDPTSPDLGRAVPERQLLLQRLAAGGGYIWKPGVQIWKPQECLHVDTWWLYVDTCVYIWKRRVRISKLICSMNRKGAG